MKVSYTQYINDYESKKRQTLSVASSEAAGDTGLILGSCSSPGEGNCNPFQYSCLRNPVDRGSWQATILGVVKCQTLLSD